MMNIDSFASGNAFIDENHEGLLHHLNVLSETVRDNWTQDGFMSDIRDFISALENHFHHEETILKGASYEDLDNHITKHRKVALDLRREAYLHHDYDSAVQFLITSRTKVISHELFEDQAYWLTFEAEGSDADPLISWSREIETGNLETDKHHKALSNYINRFYKKFTSSSDVVSVCCDLETLYAYSEHHFIQEEKTFGKKLRRAHKANHASLLLDLATLIKEVETGDYKPENLGSYLKFWLLNHIQTFDIPDFKHD